MRYPFESSQRRDSWLSHKNRGKELYEGQQYAEALREYQAALDPVLEAPRQEQQIILSNIVACRLKIGDSAELAVQEAKQCVALNPAWAKGHVRLASALVALGGHSNDACNALQTALRLDPGNAMARQMLLRELRRDHRPDPPINPDYVPPPQSQQQSPQSTQPQNSERTVWEDPVDDSVSIQERLQFYVARLSLWYDQLSSESKQILKLGIGLLVLYIAFGGRFGWESHHRRHGNYERGNLYDQYRQSYHSPPSSSYYNDYRQASPRGTHHHNSHYGSTTHYGSTPSSSDASSLASLAMVLGAAYLCHRNGINPLHAMFMMNMMGGRRRGYYGRGHFGGFRFGRPRW
ncbi:hypothetical protein FisN_20Hh168 [Fistulifera solaris]|uniref:Uncharacterized protein n=1 Tax=Fistulifera solaris TaxID=1519565 RepID=A0A1Z5JJP3_FISSO|nr:hypothetical protein FisN_20Hh168 [Fistulifera solaris]|eukprot:GAX14209.1 hypothetical protein FisN_20Hh168 [Fistulifera solaris]